MAKDLYNVVDKIENRFIDLQEDCAYAVVLGEDGYTMVEEQVIAIFIKDSILYIYTQPCLIHVKVTYTQDDVLEDSENWHWLDRSSDSIYFLQSVSNIAECFYNN